jgi:hypothetical protein
LLDFRVEMPTTKKPDIIEGSEAFEKFRDAMKHILTIPKSALPPSPFKKWKPKKEKDTANLDQRHEDAAAEFVYPYFPLCH